MESGMKKVYRGMFVPAAFRFIISSALFFEEYIHPPSPRRAAAVFRTV